MALIFSFAPRPNHSSDGFAVVMLRTLRWRIGYAPITDVTLTDAKGRYAFIDPRRSVRCSVSAKLCFVSGGRHCIEGHSLAIKIDGDDRTPPHFDMISYLNLGDGEKMMDESSFFCC